jgi:hypothetical protein
MGAPREASMGIGEYALENRWHAFGWGGGGQRLSQNGYGWNTY